MDTPRHKYSVMPVMVALIAAVISLPALAIVKVNALGMGIEHEQRWRRRTAALAAPLAFTRSILSRLRAMWTSAERHALFRPVVALSLLAVAMVLSPKAIWASPLVFGTLTEGRHTAEALMGERADGGSRESITVLSGQTLKSGAVIGRVRLGIGRVSIPVVAGGTGTGTVSNVFAGPECQVGNYVLTCTAAVTNGGVFSLTNPSGKVLPSLTMTPGSSGSTLYRSREINFTITDATDFIVGNSFTFVVGTTAPTIIGGTGTATISALALGPEAKPGNYRVICIEAITNGGRWQVYRGGPDGGVSIGEYLMSAGSTNATAFETREISFTLTDATDVIVGNYFDVAVFNQLSGGKVVAWDPTTFDGRHRAAGVLYGAIDASADDVAGAIVARDASVLKSALEWGTSITSAQKESAYADLAARGIIARDGVTV